MSLGLTQEQLAERSDLSANYIARLELAWKTPSLGTLVRLAEALEVHLSDLLEDESKAKWLDEARDIAYLLEDLDEFEAKFVLGQLRQTIGFVRQEKEVRNKV